MTAGRRAATSGSRTHAANGFTFIRICAATAVLITHTYVVLGLQGDALERIGVIGFSKLGVDTFFVISGYLVTLSLVRNPSLFVFARNRVLRIFPGLAVAVLVSALIVGPAVTSDSGYFSRLETWRYLLNAFVFTLQPYLPGVFSEQPIRVVNGSLWTLPLEVLCYVALACVASMRSIRIRFLVPLLALMLVLHLRDIFTRESTLLTVSVFFLNEFGFLFFSGASLALLGERVPLRWLYTSAALAIVVAGFYVGRTNWHYAALLYLSLWPYVVVSFALLAKRLAVLNRFDISYGVYVYGFVAQQCIVHYIPQLTNVVAFAGLSILVAYCCGAASWVFVERPALALKRRTV